MREQFQDALPALVVVSLLVFVRLDGMAHEGPLSTRGLGSNAGATGEQCVITADGPFLYHTTVFPVTAVECSTTQGRLRISTSLTRDGVQVSSARRDCRKTSVCHLTFDASVEDIPGDQQYCLATQGYVGGNDFVGTARSCESESF